jgi:hypothetical protein
MAGLVPAIHVLRRGKITKNMDARHEAGHDAGGNWLGCKTVFEATSQALGFDIPDRD